MSILVALATTALGAPELFDGPGEHARHAANPPLVAMRRSVPLPLPPPTPGPDLRVYGYLAYWADDLNEVPWDHLSDIAVFAAAVDANGELAELQNWDKAADTVEMAAPYGVRVHLCVTNFDNESIGALVGSPTARRRLIDSLVQWVDDTGADGVNIDFEGLPSMHKQDMVDFVAELDAAVGDVVLATPAVDWSDAWDYRELSRHADLFIMGYGYHWSGSGSAGPVDPLFSGDLWTARDLAWTVDDYLANGADPQRVILGLPLYGYAWSTPSDAVPSEATSAGTAVMWDDANATASSYGPRFDASSRTPFYYGGGKQGWYSSTDSVRERVRYAKESDIAGIGFWALEYDGGDQALWTMVAEETVMPLPSGGEEGVWHADAGLPFLAYPGDRIILSASGSSGPDGAGLEYLWTQIAGPRVALSDERIGEPSFLVDAPGVHVFELRVGDGITFSPPAESYVIVIDPAAGQAHDQGGCAHVGGTGLLGALGLAAVRRRRA